MLKGWGCVDKNEVIDYKLFGTRYVESFERAWERTGKYFEELIQPNGTDKYRDLENAEIWDSKKQEYTPMLRIIKNRTDEWLELTFSNGRQLDCTLDHPFEVEGKGVVYAKDLTEDDKILIEPGLAKSKEVKVNKDFAWLTGLILCDGNYNGQVTVSLGLDEGDIVEEYKEKMKKVFNVDVKVKEQRRGVKGNYYDLSVMPNKYKTVKGISAKLIGLFGGIRKLDRQIPNEVFNWEDIGRYAFLAGMIDADGYINNNSTISRVQIGSTNKELAIQQMLLAQSLGMKASMNRNRYDRDKTKIRYRVEFIPDDKLITFMKSKKKIDNMSNNIRTNKSVNTTNLCKLTKANQYTKEGYSYDVTTESEHFTVSGIYSHNCRSFLTPWKDDNDSFKFDGRFNQGK